MSTSPLNTGKAVRSAFLDYFKNQNHTVVESAPLIPSNDPTLMFTSAGMVQFKDCFLGVESRPYKRAVSAQKCLRAGGKHNDLENVGFTARHHTFFEMLGNFSFGDYFKKDAIHFAWEFVTNVLQIPKEKLYVTVFRTDDEAAEIWRTQEKVPRERIYRFDEKDNFWAAGDTGPCGPCSEIFVDRGEKYGNGPQDVMGGDGDRFMEIWNLVFMQYNRDASGKLNPLERPSIDTGAGLERLCSVLQDKTTNYDTDLFQDIIGGISELSKIKYGANPDSDVSMRVIADHCRATNFLMSDGVLPSNEGRGYVLRRIMRRAIRHGRNLGFKEPFFWQLTKPLIQQMGSVYTELQDKKDFLESNIRLEEERFLVTLDKGMHVLDEALKSKDQQIPGALAFKLYDTFGFPLDLTQVIAQEHKKVVDSDGFELAMKEQRTRSRESWKGSGEEAVAGIYKDLQSQFAKQGLQTKFIGYEGIEGPGKVLALIQEGKAVAEVSAGEFEVILDHTPFYAESGGQVGDEGKISNSHFSAEVKNVQKHFGEVIVLHVENAKGRLKVGDTLDQRVDQKIRALTAKNHTATHMLHHALRHFLGSHVKQAGSLVTPEFLRFDFTHPQGLTADEMEKIETFINERISLGAPVSVNEMEKDQAIAKGAIAFFGDKYGQKVRVVGIRDSIAGTDQDFSVELCGGTHVSHTTEIQGFKILNENGIAAGVRRITAVTGPRIVALIKDQQNLISGLMSTLKTSAPNELQPKLEKLLVSEKELRKSLEAQTRKSSANFAQDWLAQAKPLTTSPQSKLICGALPEGIDQPLQVLRDLADSIRSQVSSCVVVLGATAGSGDEKQVHLLITVSKDLQATIKAGDLVKEFAPLMDGRGGGKPDMAQAGGKKAEGLPLIFSALQKKLT